MLKMIPQERYLLQRSPYTQLAQFCKIQKFNRLKFVLEIEDARSVLHCLYSALALCSMYNTFLVNPSQKFFPTTLHNSTTVLVITNIRSLRGIPKSK